MAKQRMNGTIDKTRTEIKTADIISTISILPAQPTYFHLSYQPLHHSKCHPRDHPSGEEMMKIVDRQRRVVRRTKNRLMIHMMNV